MPDLPISGLPAATTPLAGTETLPVVQGGTTDRVTVANLTAGRAVDGLSFTATGELTAGGNINVGNGFSLVSPTKGVIAFGIANQFTFLNSSLTQSFGISPGASNLATFTGSVAVPAASELRISTDTILARDAANTLAQRNGTSAQAFNSYNTYTSGSVYERATLGWAGNFYKIFTNSASGTARGLRFGTDNTDRWEIGATTGHLIAVADNTYDIGASGANRPRLVYAANGFVAGTTGGYYWPSQGGLYSTADGSYQFKNNLGTQSFTMSVGAANVATFNGPVNTLVTTVAALPAAGTAGRRAFVTDASGPTFGAAVVGGGAVRVPVYDTGAAWFVG